ncbi:hypothetical protein C8Q75DRAFT_809329 [Abortiporus biennis]|nr:hypothetical protein C8Q75DRAFT_809329 [Abortiporus biennis]
MSSSSSSLAAKIRFLFNTPMIPPESKPETREVPLVDFPSSASKITSSQHSKHISRSSIDSVASSTVSDIPSFLPSAISARQISTLSMATIQVQNDDDDEQSSNL